MLSRNQRELINVRENTVRGLFRLHSNLAALENRVKRFPTSGRERAQGEGVVAWKASTTERIIAAIRSFEDLGDLALAEVLSYAPTIVAATRTEQGLPLRRCCSPLYFEEGVAFEVLLESLDDDLLFGSDLSDLELFEPESDLDSDFFSVLDSDLDSDFFSVLDSDFDPFSEESEPTSEAPFDALLSVT
jgi:hypothetical protein|tara:strand:+ start:541 stop:1107 length:567 start_codon:yes stop_codon:yes gene_type:complete